MKTNLSYKLTPALVKRLAKLRKKIPESELTPKPGGYIERRFLYVGGKGIPVQDLPSRLEAAFSLLEKTYPKQVIMKGVLCDSDGDGWVYIGLTPDVETEMQWRSRISNWVSTQKRIEEQEDQHVRERLFRLKREARELGFKLVETN